MSQVARGDTALRRRLELTTHLLTGVLPPGPLAILDDADRDLGGALARAGAQALLASTGQRFVLLDRAEAANRAAEMVIVVPGRDVWDRESLDLLADLAHRAANVVVLPSTWTAGPRELAVLAERRILPFAAHPASFAVMRAHHACGLALDPVYAAVARLRLAARSVVATQPVDVLRADPLPDRAFELERWAASVAGAVVVTDIPRVAVAAVLLGATIETPGAPESELLAHLDYAFRRVGGAHAILEGCERATYRSPAGEPSND